MAVTADRVIVELEARLGRYEADVRRAEARFNASMGSMRKSGNDLEKSMARNTGAIGSQFRALAGTFAAAFSAQQVAALADGYTRFTNQLKVAGQEGEQLGKTQEALFGIAQKYGVELESLGTLFSRGSQSAKELGASQGQLMQFTNGVAAALKVQGGSAASAQGALLQLSQALGSGTVRAEEFNSINEGALPILQAVAKNMDATGGSVAKLKNLVNDGKVSSQEFFAAFLKGTAALEAQAAKSSLTIAASFTILNNALGKYIGETDASLSATERVSQAIIALSQNLDTVVKALGLIAAVMVGRFAAGMLAGAASTGLLGTALFAVQARALGAATSMEALALTSRAAGASMLAVFGGPVGLAVTALALGFYYLSTQIGKTTEASGIYAQQQAQLKGIQDKVTQATEGLATATGKARREALANAEAVRQETIQYLANARAALIAAKAKAQETTTRLKAERQAQKAAPAPGVGSGGTPGMGFSPSVGVAAERNAEAEANLKAAENNVAKADAALKALDAAVKAPPRVAPVAPGKPGPKPKKGPKPKEGPDLDEIARRFQDDMDRAKADLQTANARRGLKVGADGEIVVGDPRKAKLDAELNQIETQQRITERAIQADKDLSAAQKQQLITTTRHTAEVEKDLATRASLAEKNRELEEIRSAQAEAEIDVLRSVLDEAKGSGPRKEAARRLLDAIQAQERARLEAVVADTESSKAAKEEAAARLRVLNAIQGSERRQMEKDTRSPGEIYRDEVTKTGDEINDELERVKIGGLQSLEDGLVDVIMGTKSVADAFKDMANQIIASLIRIAIQKLIIEKIAGAIFGPGAGVGARAIGGGVTAGRPYLVGEKGPELMVPGRNGTVIPNQALAAMGGGGAAGMAISVPITINAPGATAETVAMIDARIRAAAPVLVSAAQRATTKALTRPRS